MPAPRRLILSAGFLAAATFPAATTPARGQTPRPPSPGTHVPLGGALTPDQMKQALEQFGAGGLPADLGPLADLFRDLPGGVPKLDPKLRDELLRQLRSNPDLMRRAMEEASGRELGWFFEQWLYRPGQLRIAGSWTYDARAKQVRVSLEQRQGDENLIRMPIEIGVYMKGQASPTIERVQLDAKSHLFTINAASAPDDVRLDPNAWVLMDATLVRRK